MMGNVNKVLMLMVILATFANAAPSDTWFDAMMSERQAVEKQRAEGKTKAPLPDFAEDAFTFTAWIRTKEDGPIFAFTRPEGAWIKGGKSLFVRGGTVCYDIGWSGAVTGKKKVTDGNWRHVALRSGKIQTIFVDGKPNGEKGLERKPDPEGSILKIGDTSSTFPSNGKSFNGDIDDVRLFGRLLSDEEILAMAKDKADNQRGLIAHWTFDNSLDDATGGGNGAKADGKTAFVNGKLGKALSLGGKSRVIVRGSKGESTAELFARLEKRFNDDRAHREMDWEREDGVWSADWRQAPISELARRYAEAITRPPELVKGAQEFTDGARSIDDLKKTRAVYLEWRLREQILEAAEGVDLEQLRATIAHLGVSKAKASAMNRRIDVLAARAGKWSQDFPGADAIEVWRDEVGELRRELLIGANPLIDFDELIFVKRLTYNSNHYYTEFINTEWKPGGGLFALSLSDGSTREIVPSLKGGVFGRFDLSFDAKRIVFAWKCEHQQGYRIYEVNVDGAGLRQLTFPLENEARVQEMYRARPHYHHGTDDMQPCYLPDGDIAFISTRCQYGILCDAPDDFTTTIIYRMDKDGKNITALTNSSVSEASPTMLPDGRILYTRWEYVDKGAVSVKCLWAMRPDGTASAEIYANDISLPPTFIQGRPLPNSANKYVVLGTPHCPQNAVGTVIRLDMNRNIRTREPMTYMTPYVDIRAEGGFAFCDDGDDNWRRDSKGRGPLFRDPFPLSDSLFLVSHKLEGPVWTDATAYALYLLDEDGRVDLVHREDDISCFQPVPLRARPVPPVLVPTTDPRLAAKEIATCVVMDVYHGLENVERGAVKHIRVIEQVPRAWSTRRRWGGDAYDQQHVTITKDTHLGLKVQHGVVPVEEDGSAHFVVPSKKNILLQLLDENYMAVQTERTYVNYMPGETRSCVGCHETPDSVGRAMKTSRVMALARKPSVPGPQIGETSGRRPLHYPTDVQPVLDKHCIGCHSGDKPKAGLNLSGEETALFNVSYESLVPERRNGKGRRRFELLGPTIGENHPKTGNVHYMPAKSFGSHASVLVAMHSKGKVKLQDKEQAAHATRLAEVHKKVNLAPEELLRISNWVDTNAQYYGSYWGRRNLQYKEHPNYRPVPTFDVAQSHVSPIPEEER